MQKGGNIMIYIFDFDKLIEKFKEHYHVDNYKEMVMMLSKDLKINRFRLDSIFIQEIGAFSHPEIVKIKEILNLNSNEFEEYFCNIKYKFNNKKELSEYIKSKKDKL